MSEASPQASGNKDDDDDDDSVWAIPHISLNNVDGFRHAFERYGFGVVQPLDAALVQAAATLRTAALDFFRQPVSAKQPFATVDGTYGPPGWAGQGVESVQRSRQPTMDSPNKDSKDNFVADAVESFVYHGGDGAPDVPDMLQGPLQTYHKLVNALLDDVMETTALSQGLQRNFFASFYNRRSTSLRLAYYPAGNAAKYGAHTDYTGFTLLNTEKSGLQVYYNKTWIHVPCDPTTMIVNAGDLIPVWTNGRFTSALHRVVPTTELNTCDRLSIVYFTGPSDDTVVQPIVLSGETPHYEAVSAGDHLKAKLASTNR